MTDVPSPQVRRRDRSLAATTGSPANRTSYAGSSGSGSGLKPAAFSRAILRSQSQPSPAGGKPVINRPSSARTAGGGLSARGRSTAVKGSGTARHENSAETSSAEESDVSGCKRKVDSFFCMLFNISHQKQNLSNFVSFFSIFISICCGFHNTISQFNVLTSKQSVGKSKLTLSNYPFLRKYSFTGSGNVFT